MAAKFLLCLPLRLGVLLFTFFQFVVCGAAAGLVWWVLYLLRNEKDNEDVWNSIPTYLRVALIVVGGVYTLAAVVGLLGFLGAICQKVGLVKTYFTLLCTVTAFQTASSIWYLVSFYKARGQSSEDCLAQSTAPERVAFCNSMEQLKTVPQGAVIVGAILPLFIMAYAIYVVLHYIKRLNKQRVEKELRFSKSGPGYAPVAKSEETYPLTQPNMKYPYSDSTNAFGASKSHV